MAFGFDYTGYETKAKRWALTKRGKSILNRYGYTPNKNLKVLTFTEMTDNWLDFVVDCRRGIEHTRMVAFNEWNYCQKNKIVIALL